MTPEELAERTKKFAIRIAKMVDALPRKLSGEVMGRQVLRSATSIGANYREACKARSKAEFSAKIGLCQQEANETIYWIELITELKLIPVRRLTDLAGEARELLSIFVASGRTVSSGKKK